MHLVVGIGLNKTATKSLRVCLIQRGYVACYEHERAFGLFQQGRIDEVLDLMADFTCFEDWPWPLMYREIDERYPEAQFVLTTRPTADDWHRSLRKMAVRLGPLDTYERHIYGSSMPHGRRGHYTDFYERHNQEVRDYFAGRPGKLFELCISRDRTTDDLERFLGLEATGSMFPVRNVGDDVYAGDNLLRAHISRIRYQTTQRVRAQWRRNRASPSGDSTGS